MSLKDKFKDKLIFVMSEKLNLNKESVDFMKSPASDISSYVVQFVKFEDFEKISWTYVNDLLKESGFIKVAGEKKRMSYYSRVSLTAKEYLDNVDEIIEYARLYEDERVKDLIARLEGIKVIANNYFNRLNQKNNGQ